MAFEKEVLVEIKDFESLFRITLSPRYGEVDPADPYSPRLADLSKSDWQDATFEVVAFPFQAQAQTTFVGEEVRKLRRGIERFYAGQDLEFDEEEQFRLFLRHQPEDESILVIATLQSEGGPYPEIRFEVRAS